MGILTRLLILMILLSTVPAFAAERYVATTGSDTNGDGSIESPWATPVYGAAHLASGDTLYIRAGTYQIATTEGLYSAAIAPSAENVTIRSYPDESVSLIGNGGVAPTNGVISANDKNNVTIDGFTIQGVIPMTSVSGMTVQNCDISVGGDNWDGMQQGGLIYIQGCDNCTIRNNKLHDNTVQSNITNNSLIMAYRGLNLLIENNEIYNSVGAGINIKDTVVNTTIRYNYIHDNNYSGIWTANQGNPYKTYTHPQDIYIYQNIIAKNNKLNDAEKVDEHGGITFVGQTTNVDIYNNTFYNNTKADFTKWTGANMPSTYFNNISYNPSQFFLNWSYSDATMTFTYLDYNDYYTTETPQWRHPNIARTSALTFTPFSSWQTKAQTLLTGAESASITSDPGFINASGTFSNPTDFKRTSYAANGRGGSYPTVMGAYVTGSEIIGYSPSLTDIAKPVTTISKAAGRYQTKQSVTLTASESATIRYCFGAGCTPTTVYSDAINVLVNIARQTLRIQATDAAGNAEDVQEIDYRKQRRK